MLQNLVVVTQNVVAPSVIGGNQREQLLPEPAGTIAVSAMGASSPIRGGRPSCRNPRPPEEMQVEAAQLLSPASPQFSRCLKN